MTVSFLLSELKPKPNTARATPETSHMFHRFNWFVLTYLFDPTMYEYLFFVVRLRIRLFFLSVPCGGSIFAFFELSQKSVRPPPPPQSVPWFICSFSSFRPPQQCSLLWFLFHTFCVRAAYMMTAFIFLFRTEPKRPQKRAQDKDVRRHVKQAKYSCAVRRHVAQASKQAKYSCAV